MSLPLRLRKSKKKTFAPTPRITNGGNGVSEKCGNAPTVTSAQSSRLLPFMACPPGKVRPALLPAPTAVWETHHLGQCEDLLLVPVSRVL